jgi:hypothetical protein
MLKRLEVSRRWLSIGILLALLGGRAVNAQSRLDAAKAKAADLDKQAAKVDPSSRDADRIYREAAQADRNVRQIEAQEKQARENAQREFQERWQLGQDLRRENQRSGTIVNNDRNYGVKVAPQAPTRDTPARNSWEGYWDKGSFQRGVVQGYSDRDRNANISPKQDRLPSPSITQDNSRRTIRSYGYGMRSTTPKIQDRLPANDSYHASERAYAAPPTRHYVVDLPYVGPGPRDISIHKTFFYYREPNEALGHQYDAYNYLGHSAELSSQQVWAMTGMRMSSLMRSSPLDSNDDRIMVGNKFNLYHYADIGRLIRAPVEVTAVTDNGFTVETQSGHPLRGRVTHEIIKDKDNNFWLHQHGEGAAGEESEFRQEFNYGVAYGMWGTMAERISGRVFGVQRMRVP